MQSSQIEKKQLSYWRFAPLSLSLSLSSGQSK